MTDAVHDAASVIPARHDTHATRSVNAASLAQGCSVRRTLCERSRRCLTYRQGGSIPEYVSAARTGWSRMPRAEAGFTPDALCAASQQIRTD